MFVGSIIFRVGISGKYGLGNHFWPLESRFLMTKSEKNSIFSKPCKLPILISWNRILYNFLCMQIKKYPIDNVFSLHAYSGPMWRVVKFCSPISWNLLALTLRVGRRVRCLASSNRELKISCGIVTVNASCIWRFHKAYVCTVLASRNMTFGFNYLFHYVISIMWTYFEKDATV